jgi:hypothetical protein
VRGPAGIVVSIAGWMLDPVICAGMTTGMPRVDLAALVELERLLIGMADPATLGAMSQSFGRKAMKSLRLPASSRCWPRSSCRRPASEELEDDQR